ncbi:hypothetical protein HDE_06589 [Halotydeus destructor]|nr:hypothetical protein HDE_06589 [Halotydeus destructor]
MLKNPDAVKEDADMDDVVTRSGLEAVLKSNEQPKPDKTFPKLFSFSSNIHRSETSTDGRRKSFRSHTDSEGNHYSVTTKSIGDRSYTVTEKTSSNGEKERIEEFENMLERDVKLFEEEFSGKQSTLDYNRIRNDDHESASDRRRWKSYIIENLSKWF